MKDFFGDEVKIGDRVVHCGGRYKSLSRGTIIKMTPKTVTLETDSQKNLGKKTFIASSDQILLIKS